MTGWLKVYAVSTAAFFAIDMRWLGFLARDFCRRHLGGLLADQVNWAAPISADPARSAGLGLCLLRP